MFPATKPQQCVSAASLTSNVDAEIQDSVATMKVCRVCLARNMKMHHMSEHKLSVMYEQVTGVEINTEDKLPQMLCWECVARLSSAINFKEKALKTQWILLAKINNDKCLTLSDIESIDRAQYQLESTLGVKYYEVNNTDLHIQRKSDITSNAYDATNVEFPNNIYENNEVHIDSQHKIEQIFVNENDEKFTIKREYLDETEQQDEADFQIPITVIPKTENLSDDEVAFDDMSNVNEISIEVKLEDKESDVYEAKTSLSNQRSEALPHCKELRVNLEDIMGNSSKYYTQHSLKRFTAQSLKDSEIAHHPQIKEEILDNNSVEKITIYVPSVSTGAGVSLMQNAAEPTKNEFICDFCRKEFCIKSSLIRHIKMCNYNSGVKGIKRTVFTCNYCGYESYLKYRLNEHINTKHTKTISYNCTLCNYKASYKCALTRHVNAKHTKTDIYNCSLCDYSAYDKGTLSKHINSKHTKINVHKCSYCSFKTYQKGYLNVHVNAKHTKTNVYNCSYCSFKTYKKFNLSAHVNAKHTKTYVYSCSICSYNAYDKSTLSKHVNAKHTKANVYNCSLCDYITYDKNSISKHVNAKHTKKNSFNCSHCNYKTYDRSALSKHNNSKHTKKISYDCSHCSYKTYRRSTLSKHVNAKHTKSISYNCSLCDYKAYQKSNLTTHVNVKHSTSTDNS